LEPYLKTLRARDRRLREERSARAREVEARLPALASVLTKRFSVRRVVVFGSLLSGELYEASDLDLAVDGLAPEDYWRALDAVSCSAGAAVDLIRLEDAPDALKQRIAREGRVLHG
jgi:predicted nucleotidyltransferase